MGRIPGVLAFVLLIALIAFVPWKGAARHHHDINEKIGIAEKLDNDFLADEKKDLTKIIHAALGTLEKDTDLDKVKKILKHQATFAKFEFHQFDQTKQKYRALVIYSDMRFGNIGYMCNGHADMFLGLLEIYGVPGRRILGESIIASHPRYQEYQRSEVYGSHSTVEVRIDGRWVLADPTFFMLPKHRGKYIALHEGLEILCKDRSARFEFEAVSDRYPVEKFYQGRTNEYFRDMMFSRVIVYKPFHKYPYDDAYRSLVKSASGMQYQYFTLEQDLIVESLTPASIPWAALHRESSPIVTAATRGTPGGAVKNAD